jgi:hypothetical protein
VLQMAGTHHRVLSSGPGSPTSPEPGAVILLQPGAAAAPEAALAEKAVRLHVAARMSAPV